jgi:hypothetical protein
MSDRPIADRTSVQAALAAGTGVDLRISHLDHPRAPSTSLKRKREAAKEEPFRANNPRAKTPLHRVQDHPTFKDRAGNERKSGLGVKDGHPPTIFP